ncbi:MAG: hypothetical protein JWO80_775 [Bryobacterales bacterium]|nr:hypothetical protein [Bryobacterales bacterium]
MNLKSASFTTLKNLVLLAPAGAARKESFENVWRSNAIYSKLLADMQRLRGRVYLQDGAIEDSALTPDGRHQSECDESSWHLLTLDAAGRVLGCMRYFRPNLTRFDTLNLRRAALAKSRTWCPELYASIRAELAAARRARFSYIEVGGWALTEQLRGTTEALRGVLATYAWAQHIGGALGIATATERNGSRLILRRLGGRPFEWEGEELPPYQDHHYRCKMELLRFDSREPNAKYRDVVDSMRQQFPRISVVCPTDSVPWQAFGASLLRLAATPLWTEELMAGFS